MNDQIDPVEEEKKAIDLIARSPEGHLLHRYLRRVLESCIDFVDDSPLRYSHGRRTLARDLMLLMSKGIADTATVDGRRTTDPILNAPRAARGVARTGLARRVQREPDDGWGEFSTDAGPATGSGSAPAVNAPEQHGGGGNPPD